MQKPCQMLLTEQLYRGKMETKQDLRLWAKEERSKLNIEHLSTKLCENLVKKEEYRKAKNVLIFYPLKGEVNLLPLLKDKSKTFYLPKIDGEDLKCCSYKEGDKTELSCFKTQEPLTQSCAKSRIDLAIIPALACQQDGYRLGYGRGFYDRFLKDFEGVSVVCIPKNLIVKTVFPEKHDVKINIVITEADDI